MQRKLEKQQIQAIPNHASSNTRDRAKSSPPTRPQSNLLAVLMFPFTPPVLCFTPFRLPTILPSSYLISEST